MRPVGKPWIGPYALISRLSSVTPRPAQPGSTQRTRPKKTGSRPSTAAYSAASRGAAQAGRAARGKLAIWQSPAAHAGEVDWGRHQARPGWRRWATAISPRGRGGLGRGHL